MILQALQFITDDEKYYIAQVYVEDFKFLLTKAKVNYHELDNIEIKVNETHEITWNEVELTHKKLDFFGFGFLDFGLEGLILNISEAKKSKILSYDKNCTFDIKISKKLKEIKCS